MNASKEATTVWQCGACSRHVIADKLPDDWHGGETGCVCPKCHQAGVARVRRSIGPNRTERTKLRSGKYRKRMAKDQRRQEKREARQAAAREKEAKR